MIEDIHGEIWIDVNGYEGIYQVSSMGRLKSLSRKIPCRGGFRVKQEAIRKPAEWAKDWYVTYVLAKNHINRTVSGHWLVASHFINNPEMKPEINHKNGIKSDNRIENLEWVTSSENRQHSYDTGLQKIKKGVAHHLYGRTGLNSNSAILILDTQTGIYYESIKEAAIAKQIGKSWLTRKLNGTAKNNTGLVYA